MTPKDKAFELVTKYSRILPMNQTTLLDRKNCAVVAVDEIINSVDDEHVSDIFNDYWTKVKKEIEKI
jgi:hypothetical protein